VPDSPEAAQLAGRLRQLRMQWADKPMTQAQLAAALVLGPKDTLSAATVSSWENSKTPKPPPERRLEAYARFFATRRSVETTHYRLLPLEDFSPGELAEYLKLKKHLDDLRAKVSPDNRNNRGMPAARSWHFNNSARVVIVCAQLPPEQRGPLADPSDPNRTKLHGIADADSLTELFGHIKAENPTLDVEYKTPARIEDKDLTGHLVILGGVIWNEVSERLSTMARIPVKQIEDERLESGEIFVSEENGERREYFPQWTRELLSTDVGLLARVPNPLNASNTLTICNGIHSRGVYGAVRALIDKSLRDSNERYISASFGDASSFAILMSVEVIRNEAVTPDFNSVGVVLYKWPSLRSRD
jgi:transcriptional regulator with XRE-family HTH domain